MENDRSGTLGEGNGGRENRGREIMMDKYRKEERKLQGEREDRGRSGTLRGMDAKQGVKDGSERWREVGAQTVEKMLDMLFVSSTQSPDLRPDSQDFLCFSLTSVLLLHPLASLCASPPRTHPESL